MRASNGVRRSKRARSQSGMTLLEMMIAVGIMAVLMRMAAPSFSSFIAEARLSSNSEAFASAFKYARNEAGMSNIAVTVSPLSGTDWTSGSQVRQVKLGTATLLRQTSPMSGAVSMTYSGGSAPTSVTFYPDGSTNLTSGGAWVRMCDTSVGSVGRAVIINGSGYVSSTPTFATGGSGAVAAC